MSGWHSGGVEKDAASPVESIDRALVVLVELAAAGTRGLTLGQLAERLGVHKTTVHRALAALRFREFVAQDAESGAYRLGAGAVTLGDAYYAGDNLAAALHPALVALAQDLDELVHLGVLTGTQIVYLDKVEPERPVRVWSAVGRRMPAVTTALGRALLASRVPTRAALAPYLLGPDGAARPDGEGGGRTTGDRAVGSRTTGDRAVGNRTTGDRATDRAWDAMARVSTDGYAYEIEENEPGIACVAVPLVRAGAAVAAVSVTAPVERMTRERMGEVATRMRAVLPELLPPGLAVR